MGYGLTAFSGTLDGSDEDWACIREFRFFLQTKYPMTRIDKSPKAIARTAMAIVAPFDNPPDFDVVPVGLAGDL